MRQGSLPIVICGASGMLGWDLAQAVRRLLPTVPCEPLSHSVLDISHEDSVREMLARVRPSLVFNAAAYTNVDGAEREIELARRVNGEGPACLAKACHDFGAKLVHFSTDQVFDGSGDVPREETEVPSPSNAYATTKLMGERAVLDYPRHLVLRVQWLYGERKDRFTPLKTKPVFTPFIDQFGAPTWTKELSETVIQLVEKDAAGLFHFAYDDFASWAEVYEFARDELKLPTRLEGKKTSEVSLPAKRPLNSRLSNKKLLTFLGLAGLGSWKTPLREFLKTRL